MASIFKLLNKTQDELLEYCENYLKNKKYSVLKTKDFVFGTGNIPILLVAHLDTVHKKLPEIYFDNKKRVIWSPDGIGGDDRCGVYAILKILETHKPYVLFTTNEETGGQGALAFTETFKKTSLAKYINFIIEIDRRGYNQAVFYDCGNANFKKYILSFDFKEQYGSFTDISIISPVFDIASVNFSAGYYNEHTSTEYIVLADLEHTIEKVKEILDDKKNHKYYDYQEVEYQHTPIARTYGIQDYSSYIPYYVTQDFYDLKDDDWFEYYGYEKPRTYKELKERFNKQNAYDYD